MIIKHYYRFPKHVTDKFNGDVLDKENWDILRNDDATPFFMIPENKKGYDEYCARESKYEKRALLIIESLKEAKFPDEGSLCSLGIGIGILEWHIINMCPNIHMCCTDFAEEGLKKVATMLNAKEFKCFDMSVDDFSVISDYDCLLMYRISTEFDIDTWKKIFSKAYQACCEMICFVPTEFATIEDEIREREGHQKCLEKGEKDMFCGWLYSEDEFISMFSKWYKIVVLKRVDNTGIFVLKRNKENRD